MKTFGTLLGFVLLLSTCFAADNKIVESRSVETAKSLSGTVVDTAGFPLSDVRVIEVKSNWQGAERSTVTDSEGRWSLIPTANRQVYYIRIVASVLFKEVRLRVRVDSKTVKDLRIEVPLVHGVDPGGWCGDGQETFCAEPFVRTVRPVYPPEARRLRIQGPVTLKAVIGKDGKVRSLELVGGHPLLVPAAMEAVKQWKYKPYYENGKAVEVETTVVVNFTLAGAGDHKEAGQVQQ